MKAKVGNTGSPIANGTTKPATSAPASAAKSGGDRTPNQDLKPPSLGTPNGIDAQNNAHPNKK